MLWKYQPGARLPSWCADIAADRLRVREIPAASPSLAARPLDTFAACHRAGCLRAADETGIDVMLFPVEPPFTVERALDPDFLPSPRP